MNLKYRFVIILFLIVFLVTACTANARDELSSVQSPILLDDEILHEVHTMQQHLKIGASKEMLENEFQRYITHAIQQESGDEPWEEGVGYIFSVSDDPFTVSVGDAITTEGMSGVVTEVLDHQFFIETSSGEQRLMESHALQTNLQLLINSLIVPRKIGAVAHVFFDNEDKVYMAFITFVHGPNNNIYRIHYLDDGTTKLTINEFREEIS